MSTPTRIVIALVTALSASMVLGAQSTAPVGVDLSGTWALNAPLSDNPEQVAAAIRIDLGLGAAGAAAEGTPETGRFGRRGGDGLPGNSPRGRSNRPDQPSADELNRLNDLTAPLRYPPTMLTISQTAETVTFTTDTPGHTQTLTTNGKREKVTVGSNTIDVTTKWEGPQLITEQDLGKDRKVIITYAVVASTKQLLVRTALERAPLERGPFEIKYVYDRAAQ